MKVIKFLIKRYVNQGTEETPMLNPVFYPSEIKCKDNDDLTAKIAFVQEIANDGQYTVGEVPDPPMTAEEARAQRKKLLEETDWTQALDSPITTECREAFRVYRQALRDITEQAGFPDVIEWPAMPEVVKADPDPVDTAVDALLGEEVSV